MVESPSLHTERSTEAGRNTFDSQTDIFITNQKQEERIEMKPIGFPEQNCVYAKDQPPGLQAARKPAEVWPVGHFIENEMNERGWTRRELVSRLGGGATTELEIDLLIFAPTKGVLLGAETAADIARVFGTSAELWLNLDKAWQDNGRDSRSSPAQPSITAD